MKGSTGEQGARTLTNAQVLAILSVDSLCFALMLRVYCSGLKHRIMENQVDKKMGNEMDTAFSTA